MQAFYQLGRPWQQQPFFYRAIQPGGQQPDAYPWGIFMIDPPGPLINLTPANSGGVGQAWPLVGLAIAGAVVWALLRR